MTLGISAFGTLLKIGDGGTPETFTTIAEVRDISGPSLALDTADVTSHDSPGGWEEHIGTILRSGEITFTVNFVPTHATHNPSTGLIADMVNREVRNFQLVFPNVGNTTWAFAALVTGFEPAEPVDDALTADVTLKLTGQPSLS
jgi:predicted secreted protein